MISLTGSIDLIDGFSWMVIIIGVVIVLTSLALLICVFCWKNKKAQVDPGIDFFNNNPLTKKYTAASSRKDTSALPRKDPAV